MLWKFGHWYFCVIRPTQNSASQLFPFFLKARVSESSFFAEIDSKLLFLFSIERERFRGHKITLIQKSFCLKLRTTFESRRTVAKNGPQMCFHCIRNPFLFILNGPSSTSFLITNLFSLSIGRNTKVYGMQNCRTLVVGLTHQL